MKPKGKMGYKKKKPMKKMSYKKPMQKGYKSKKGMYK